MFGPREVDEILGIPPRAACSEPPLVCCTFLNDARRTLRPGGRLVLKTDDSGYSRRVLALSDRGPLLHSPDYWNDPAAQAVTAGRMFANECTVYESRFVARRRPIFYVEFASEVEGMTAR